MPYKSKKQERFFHTDTAKKKGITEDEVNEFDKASKGKKLPEKKMAYGGETNAKHETIKSMENNPTAGFADGGEVKEPPVIDPKASEDFREGFHNGIQGDWDKIKDAISNTGKAIHDNYEKGMGDNGNLKGLQNVADQKAKGYADGGQVPPMVTPGMPVNGGYPGAGTDNLEALKSMIGNLGVGGFMPGSSSMNQMATGIGQGITAPGTAGIVNNALGTNLSDASTQPPQIDQDFMNKLNAGTAMTPPPAPQAPHPILQASQAMQNTPSTNPSIYQGISAEDRAALAQKLMANKASPGALAASGAGGLADAITSSFGKSPTNFQQNIRGAQQQGMEQQLNTMDTQRTQKLQDLQANYAAMEQDPNSPISQGMRNFLKQNGVPAPSGMNAAMIKVLLPDIAKMFEARTQAAIAGGAQGVEAGKALMGETLWEQLRDSLGMGDANEAGEQYLQNRVGGAAPTQFTHSTPSGIKYGVK